MNEAETKKLVDGLDWMTIWPRVDHAEKIATGIMGYPNDPRREEAAKILEIVERVRQARKRGWSVPAGEIERLRRLSDAANDKIMRPLIEQAAKTRAGFADRTAPVNLKRHLDAEAQHSVWQSEADKIWNRRPELSKTAVAALVAEKHGGKLDTIRRKLARPSQP